LLIGFLGAGLLGFIALDRRRRIPAILLLLVSAACFGTMCWLAETRQAAEWRALHK